MGRHAIYLTIEDKRKAQNEASKRFHAKKKALKEAEKQSPEQKPVQKEPKALPPSYTREYHQARYLAKKKSNDATSLSSQGMDSEIQSLD
jgi:hypothetical protein